VAFEQPRVDRPHERDIGEAVRADVPDRGESGQQRGPRVRRPAKRAVHRRLPDRPSHPLALEVHREVGVDVDQARQ